MKTKNTIEVFNSLILVNNDRMEGYENASEETEEQDLKTLFLEFIAISKKCKQELVREVYKLGGEVAEDTVMRGKFFRVWMDVKAALTNKDREAILNSCDYGENKTQDAYRKVLEDDLKTVFKHMNLEQQIMIITQKSLLKSDRVNITSLQNMLVNVTHS